MCPWDKNWIRTNKAIAETWKYIYFIINKLLHFIKKKKGTLQ